MIKQLTWAPYITDTYYTKHKGYDAPQASRIYSLDRAVLFIFLYQTLALGDRERLSLVKPAVSTAVESYSSAESCTLAGEIKALLCDGAVRKQTKTVSQPLPVWFSAE